MLPIVKLQICGPKLHFAELLKIKLDIDSNYLPFAGEMHVQHKNKVISRCGPTGKSVAQCIWPW